LDLYLPAAAIASPKESYLSSNEIVFQNLIHEINDDLVVHKNVFRMTQLLEQYKAYLPADAGTYSSAKLHKTLFLFIFRGTL
jgi:hypothetical protein